jgi:cysteine desulfurase/selenocysteine lyase
LKSKTCTSRSTAPLLARYGVTATCRASFALYNTKDEVDTLAESMVKAREFFA